MFPSSIQFFIAEHQLASARLAAAAAVAWAVRKEFVGLQLRIVKRSSPTFHRVTPPRFEGAGSRPSRDQRHTVGTLTLKSAATTATRALALSGSRSKCSSDA